MMFGKFIDIRTNGIDIHTDVTLSRVSKSNLSSPPVRVNLWDLGGQPEFHPTHLFFMPGTQIFLVIFDISDQSAGTLSTTQSTRIMYWLNCISTNCQDYSMITTVLVASHKDKCPPADRKVILQKLAARYLPHYPHLYKEILSVCGISGSGFNKLERLLYMIVSDTKYTQTVQHSWVVFYEKICSLQMTHAVISLDTFKEEMRNCEVPDEDKHDLIQFLQSVGAILYFQDSRGLLSSTVILRPSWVSSAMASLVSFKTRIHADSGFVSKSALQAALGSNDEVLLKLLQRFGIVVQHRKSEKFVVPLLLETNLEPLKFPSEKTGDVYFTRSYVSEFNSGFFSCLLVHILQLKFQPLILKRYAVLLQYHAHQQALINMIHGTIGNPSTLEIRVRGPAALGANHRCELLRELHDVVMNTINFHSPQSVHRKLAVFVEYEVSKQVYKWPTDFVVSKLNSGFIQLGNGQISLENIAPDIALSDCVRIDYSDLRIIEKLGQGGGGCAYLAAYREAYVVVKTVDAEVVTHDYSSWEEFLSEISMHSAFDHPNITRMLGYTIKQNSLGLVMEFMEGTDLYHQIKELNEKSQEEIEMIFPIIKRIQIAIDIVNGMKYLHSRDPCVIHRDLRSPNVLLSHSLSKPASHRLTAKITDFGLSRKFYYSPMVGCQRTWQWMAPEIIESYYDSSYKYTNQVDIYSFGIVLWELLTLQFPFGEYEKNPIYFNSETNNFDVRKIIRDIQQNHLRPSIPEEFEENPLTKPLCDLIRQCWHPIPNNRPKFLKVLLLLTQIYHKYPSVRSADPPVGPDEIFTTCDQKFTSREVKKRFKHEKLSTVGTFAISDILNIDNTGTLPSIRTVLVFVQDNKPYRVLVGCETGELLMYPTREYVCVSDSEVCYLGQLSSELFYYATLNGRICIQNINTPHVSIQAWQGHVDNHISCVCPLTCNDRLLFCVGSPEQGGLYIWDVHVSTQ
jgi:serine/threonine protein kinase/GTPase SAR1 family protein